ncbi:MAG: DUF4153 domain-containing protein [Ginsengibacter sp.]
MKRGSSKLLLVLTGAFIFNILFWNEKIGVNAVIFDAFVGTAVFVLYPETRKNRISLWLLAAQTATLALIIIQNTVLSKVAFAVTLALFVAFSEFAHQSVFFAGGSIISNYISAVSNFLIELGNMSGNRIRISGWIRRIRLFIIPIAILSVFFAIYASANVVFSNMFSDALDAIVNWLTNIFSWFSFDRVAFFFLGIFIVSGILIRSGICWFSEKDMNFHNTLTRKKNRFKKWRETAFADLLQLILGKTATGNLALKNEYRIGTVSIILLNILLLVINVLDIRYVWLGIGLNSNTKLSAYVHEGAGLLILSIILAMLVLLFFFRGNINFYKQDKWLKYGAYLWILQNTFLVASVFCRDYYYISSLGLAYKRIGLLFFLAMVLAGLVTILLKIHLKKTVFYLLRTNGWVALVLLVVSSCVNWDVAIAKYNLQHKATIKPDVHFLLSLSDEALPVLQENEEVFQNASLTNIHYFFNNDYHSPLEYFNYRKEQFISKEKQYSWLSWNLADASALKELE